MLDNLRINTFDSIEEFVSGSILLIDKPLGWTSFDAVNRIKGWVRNNIKIPLNAQGDKQRFKIGHAGTLDPLATGLLVICTGKMTKQIDHFQVGMKEYTGTITFGKTTPSFDAETEPVGDFSTAHLNMEGIRKCAATFIGEQLQVPPAFSAKQVDGKRAYESARKGVHVEIAPVKITVYDYQITRFENLQTDFIIRCSKGTYIRTMAHETGVRLDTGSYLTKLRRTESSPFRIEDALSVDDLIARLRETLTISPS